MSSPRSLVVRAWAAAAVALTLVFCLHLTTVLITGMLVYVIGAHLTNALRRRTRLRRPALASVLLLVLLMVLAGSVVDALVEAAFSGNRSQHLVEQVALGLDRLQTSLPVTLAAHVPASLTDLRAAAVTWLRNHAGQVRLWGEESLRVLAYVLVGLVIGLLAMMHTASSPRADAPSRPWLQAMSERFRWFEQSFSAVVFAQLRIAMINTALTAVYVLGVLPLLHARLPLAITVLVITFVAGLLPLVGNLVSSAIIVVLSITQGLGVAALSVVFLAVVHKSEYVLNAIIVGRRIHTRAFELLIVMVVFEAAWGIPGLILAPVVYAYAKAELQAAGALPAAWAVGRVSSQSEPVSP